MKTTNWGNYPVTQTPTFNPSFEEDVIRILQASDSVIARGNGRCYGDSSLGGKMISTLNLNKILAFDRQTGLITCQAGVLLSDVIEVAVPYGFFLPVTPGTKFVTIGGAIASDVHGKNHHSEGTFGQHVTEMEVLLADGQIVTCSPSQHADLFWTTCGGMGLTGIVLKATFRLKKIETAYIRQEQVKARNLEEIMDLFAESESWTYTVSWLDTSAHGKDLGRSIMMRGEHASLEELPQKWKKNPLALPKNKKLNIPFYFPSFLINDLTLKIMNRGYYFKSPKKQWSGITHYDPYYYPLDSILNWNRVYGKNGFTQYQFVLPPEASREGLRKVLERLEKYKQYSFVTVLKLFGKAYKEAVLSFPMEGYNLAMDFKICPEVMKMLDELDAIVADYGGRLYLAKDARMKAEFFHQSYANSHLFRETLDKWQARCKFHSLQSDRLKITV
ncbi:FAD-binding oxidoreductase [Rapidithrix thailandica]|uniref:FAD-binding oxidoreductase n=1 Tax=Rapidithrix thailandica TaxID=413964 RepID=A0AAW9S322_9BACT